MSLFEIECKDYLHREKWVEYCERYHQDNPQKIQDAKKNLEEFKRDMILFHGDIAKNWFANQRS